MNIDIEQLKRLAEAATPGPWEWRDNLTWAWPQTEVRIEGADKRVVRFTDGKPDFSCTIGKAEREWANAAYIAAANPQAVCELISTIEQLQAENATIASNAVEMLKNQAALIDEQRASIQHLQAENANHKLAWEDRDTLDKSLAVLDRQKDDEIAELRTENAKLALELDHATMAATVEAKFADEMKAERDAARRELEEARKDAGRIDFLESECFPCDPGNYYLEERYSGGNTFREAIDAARQQKG